MDVNVDVITYFLAQGPFAVLFIWLLINTQNYNAKREDRPAIKSQVENKMNFRNDN